MSRGSNAYQSYHYPKCDYKVCFNPHTPTGPFSLDHHIYDPLMSNVSGNKNTKGQLLLETISTEGDCYGSSYAFSFASVQLIRDKEIPHGGWTFKEDYHCNRDLCACVSVAR